MNELPVARYLCLRQGIARGSPGGKHCKSPEGNVWRKVISTPKNMVLGRDQHFFAAAPPQMYLGDVDT